MKKKIIVTLVASALCAFAYGCGSEPVSAVVPTTEPEVTVTAVPTSVTTELPTSVPTNTPEPTVAPTMEPTQVPTEVPTNTPTPTAAAAPTATPTVAPTSTPTPEPTATSAPVPTNTPTPEPTATATPTPTVTPKPTATSTPVPTSTPRPTPTTGASPTPRPKGKTDPPPPKGDGIDIIYGDCITLECGVEMAVLEEYNTAGLYSADTRIYGWFGDGQDNRDNSALKSEEMYQMMHKLGMFNSEGHQIGTGFYWSNYSIQFYWDSIGPTPDLALYRDIDNKCYYLAINYDLTEGGTVTPKKARDVLRMLLSICSSSPIELEEEIYIHCFGPNYSPLNIWIEVGDTAFYYPEKNTNGPNGMFVYYIRQK